MDKYLKPAEEERLAKISKPLLAWYDQNRRILPWREEPTPYHVWVSEIMLQQTRVDAVKGYYARFMEALPDIASLCEASEDVLLKLWEGLGYYNRVRNMQKCAMRVIEEHEGVLPSDWETLLTLPGIGHYTAGAISSIAYGKVNPAVDGNVLRVVTRMLALDQDIMKTAFREQVEGSLRNVMSQSRPGDFNQAMMDIGATVCIPNGAPLCEKCPLQSFCKGSIEGTACNYPVKAKKKERRLEDKTILVLQDHNRIALCKRPNKGLLAGLYGFPMTEGKLTDEQVRDYLKIHGMHAIRIRSLGEAKHVFSHVEWHMIGYQILVDELEPWETDGNLLLVEIQKAKENYAIPSAYKAYAELFLKEGNLT